MTTESISQPPTGLAHWLPALGWLRAYDRSWLRGDIVAGITLAAYLLPAGLGDASLANLPPEAGLYACLFGGLVFWLFCSSRHTVITVTSAISLLIGASLGEIAGGDTTRFGALAAGTALLVALIAFLALAGESRGHREFHFGKRHDRIQVRCGAVPRQHAIAEALRLPWRSREFLGEQRPLPQAPARNKSRVADYRRCRVGSAGPRQSVPEEQTGGALRRHRRHRRRVAVSDWKHAA